MLMPTMGSESGRWSPAVPAVCHCLSPSAYVAPFYCFWPLCHVIGCIALLIFDCVFISQSLA
jgi:hypothetical protein